MLHGLSIPAHYQREAAVIWVGKHFSQYVHAIQKMYNTTISQLIFIQGTINRVHSVGLVCQTWYSHQYRTVFLLCDQVVLGFDIGLEGVDIFPLVLLDVGGHPLQDVVRRGRAAPRAALGTAWLGCQVVLLVSDLVFLNQE